MLFNWFATKILLSGLGLSLAALSVAFLVQECRVAETLRTLRDNRALAVSLLVFAALATVEAQKNPQRSPRRTMRTQQGTVVTETDVARGFRLVETIDETHDYAMPTNAAIVGNWHKRGAYGDWLRFELGWGFPLGTNGAAFSSFSVFTDAKIRPTPRDREREFCAIGVPMLAMQGASRFWTCDGTDDEKILSWDNFFLNADTNAPVCAQIVLERDGDFTVWSNDVGRVYARINPDDWDDDGLANVIDPVPLTSDGDCYGTGEGWWSVHAAAVAVTNAIPDAYYPLAFAATADRTRIDIVCDGASDLGDFVIIANAGQVCEVPLLKGANYAVRSSAPLADIALGDENAEIVYNDDLASIMTRAASSSRNSANFDITSVLDFSLEECGDGSWRVVTSPTDVGARVLAAVGGCCTIMTNATGFVWNCNGGCGCGGYDECLEVSVEWCGYGGSFSKWLSCGCEISAAGPHLALSASPGVVCFAEGTTNTNRAALVCDYRAEKAGTYTLDISGDSVTVRDARGGDVSSGYSWSVDEGASGKRLFTVGSATKSSSPSGTVFAVTFVPDDGTCAIADTASVAFVAVSVVADALWPSNRDRRTFGVFEEAQIYMTPKIQNLSFSCTGTITGNGAWSYEYVAPSNATTDIVRSLDGSHICTLDIIAPSSYNAVITQIVNHATQPCEAGSFEVFFQLELLPSTVSFAQIEVMEQGMSATNATGYFAEAAHLNLLSHSYLQGAWEWTAIGSENNEAGHDIAGVMELPTPWNGGGLMTWPIPNVYRKAGESWISEPFCNTDQSVTLEADGTVWLEKFNLIESCTTNRQFNGWIRTIQ